jgi:hypothetical protein
MTNPTTSVTYTGDGTTSVYSVPFDYIAKTDVRVTVGGVTASFTWTSPTTIQISPTPANAAAILVKRVTSLVAGVNFSSGALRSSDLNRAYRQNLYLRQEAANAPLGDLSVDPFVVDSLEAAGDVAAGALEADTASIGTVVSDWADVTNGLTAGSVTTPSASITALAVGSLSLSGNFSGNYLPTHADAVARSLRVKLSERVSVLDFGADPSGVATANAAFNKAIIAANATGKNIYIPTGHYKITASLEWITRHGVQVYGDGPANTFIDVKGVPGAGSGNAAVQFVGGGSTGPGGGVWLYGCGITDLMFDCDPAQMLDGDCLKADCVWDFWMERVWIEEGFNGVFLRQYNTVHIRDCRIQNTKGTYCVHAYGSGATRNGMVDRGDAIYVEGTTLTGNQPVSNPYGIWMDGFAHTLQYNGLVLWYLGRGIYTTNTPGVAADNCPSFFLGHNLQAEQNRYGAVVFSAPAQEVFLTGIYIWGVTEGEGIVSGQMVKKIALSNGKIESCSGSGIAFENAQGLAVSGIYSFNNGAHGLYVGNTSDLVTLTASSFYNNTGRGIAANSATRVLANGCVTSGNGLANNGTIATGNSFT